MRPPSRRLSSFLMYGQHFLARFVRPMTLGVRAVALDGENRVLLVRHSYIAGWHLPGGGVEAGETLRQALRRELAEEGAIEALEEPELFAVYHNTRFSRRDHVALYVVRSFRQIGERKADWEIVETGFFLPTICRRVQPRRHAPVLPKYWTVCRRVRFGEIFCPNRMQLAFLSFTASRFRFRAWAIKQNFTLPLL